MDYNSQVPAGRPGPIEPPSAPARGLLGAVVGGGEKMASKVNLVLRPVKSIVVRFCPFEPNVESTRKFLQCIYHKKVQATNTNCEVTADVRHDGSEPVIDVMFADGDRLIMKGAHLTTGEMLSALESRCNAKDLKEEQKSKKNP